MYATLSLRTNCLLVYSNLNGCFRVDVLIFAHLIIDRQFAIDRLCDRGNSNCWAINPLSSLFPVRSRCHEWNSAAGLRTFWRSSILQCNTLRRKNIAFKEGARTMSLLSFFYHFLQNLRHSTNWSKSVAKKHSHPLSWKEVLSFSLIFRGKTCKCRKILDPF